MAFTDYNRKYDEEWNLYPVYAQEFSIEGAFKRYTSMPGPVEVFEYAMLGLPRFLPLTQQMIGPDGLTDIKTGQKISVFNVQDFLTSAVTEIEMDMDCNLSEVTHFHTEDMLDGMGVNNFYGIRLSRWPATQVVRMSLKYPHATNSDDQLYAEYTFPRGWISLRRNKINVVASVGQIFPTFGGGGAISDPGGLYTYLTGFDNGSWRPNAIEVIYKAGFDHDKMPAVVADLIKTWAAHRFLTDIGGPLFPNNSVNVSIDGISQSVGLDIQRLIGERVSKLEEKKEQQKRAFQKAFGQTIGMSFIGS